MKNEEQINEVIEKLGELCHESYIGFSSITPNEYEYCYKNEVINLLDTPEAREILKTLINNV